MFLDSFEEFRTDSGFSQVIVEDVVYKKSVMLPVSADIQELMVSPSFIDRARDDAHPGPKSNQVIAERIYEKLKK